MESQSASGAQSTFTDYVRDLSMEVGHMFYPLATVSLPPNVSQQVFPPTSEIYDDRVYDFSCELLAIDQYQKLHRVSKLERPQKKLSKEGLPSPTTIACTLPSASQSVSVQSNTKVEIDDGSSVHGPSPIASAPPPPPLLTSNGILQPQLVPLTKLVPSTQSAITEQNGRTNGCVSWADFERNDLTNPFDSLLTKAMDDRAMLRQVLVPCSAEMCHSAAVTTTQSNITKPANVSSEPTKEQPSNRCMETASAEDLDMLPPGQRSYWPSISSDSSAGLRPQTEHSRSPDSSRNGAASLSSLDHHPNPTQDNDSALDESALTSEQRAALSTLVDIGFDRRRTIRALLVLNVPADITQLLNFFAVVDWIEQECECSLPSELVEQATVSAAYDKDLAMHYSRVGVQLAKLGFGAAPVCTALHKHNGSRQAALDDLLLTQAHS